jgi:hypothetical protein
MYDYEDYRSTDYHGRLCGVTAADQLPAQSIDWEVSTPELQFDCSEWHFLPSPLCNVLSVWILLHSDFRPSNCLQWIAWEAGNDITPVRNTHSVP